MRIKEIDHARIGDVVIFKPGNTSQRVGGKIEFLFWDNGRLVELKAKTVSGNTYTVERGNICNIQGELKEEGILEKTVSDDVDEIIQLIDQKIKSHEQSIENLKRAKEALS